jgi:poly-beta-1,6-N-acetyl-D-glucosamine synthase
VKIIFLLSLGGILYTYLGYPIGMWVLSRLWRRKHMIAAITPSVSVVLAVHNGVERMPAKLKHLLDLDYSEIKEIIIASDGSTDGTAEFLQNVNDPRVKTVILCEHGGKAVAVNAGVGIATGEILLFVDIRPEIAPGAVQHMVNNFADPAVGCVAGDLILKVDGHDAASGAVGGLYWRYEQWIRKCEADFDSPVGVYGGFYAIRRELFTPMPAGIILDDMFQPLSIIRQGFRSVLDANAFVYDMWPNRIEGEFHRKVRTLAGNFQLFKMAPWSLTPQNRTVLQLFSHKVMRLLVPYFMTTLLISSAVLSPESKVFAIFTSLQLLVWVLALAGLRYHVPGMQKFVSPASALLTLNVAAVVGLYRFLFTHGPLWKIWNLGKYQSLQASTAISIDLGSVAATAAVEEASLVRK